MTTTIPEFAWRIETCGTCDARYGECYDCGGHSEWYASCADCGEERPLNTNGVCESCQAVNGWLEFPVQALANGVHRVSV